MLKSTWADPLTQDHQAAFAVGSIIAPEKLAELRQQIAQQTQEYLTKGGAITQLPQGACTREGRY